MQCGLVRIEETELRNWWNDPAARLQVRTWDAADGAQGALAPFAGAARTPDGRLWFANDNVLQMIDPRVAKSRPVRRPGAGDRVPVHGIGIVQKVVAAGCIQSELAIAACRE